MRIYIQTCTNVLCNMRRDANIIILRLDYSCGNSTYIHVLYYMYTYLYLYIYIRERLNSKAYSCFGAPRNQIRTKAETEYCYEYTRLGPKALSLNYRDIIKSPTEFPPRVLLYPLAYYTPHYF